MNLGFDLHGVIDKKPEEFKHTADLFISMGCKIFIISGSSIDKATKELSSLGIKPNIHYHKILSVTDSLLKGGLKGRQDDNGNWWFEEISWWQEKGNLCLDYNIDIMFDDSEKYELHMPSSTKFVLVKI
jgi:hypothetical protein